MDPGTSSREDSCTTAGKKNAPFKSKKRKIRVRNKRGMEKPKESSHHFLGAPGKKKRLPLWEESDSRNCQI